MSLDIFVQKRGSGWLLRSRDSSRRVATVLYMIWRLIEKSGAGRVTEMIYSERKRHGLYQPLVSYTFIVHRESHSRREVTTPLMTGP